MRCPYCSNQNTKVLDSRETGENEEVTRRRRECLKCSKRFTTYERVEMLEIFVIKKDSKRELFDRDKIRKGLLKAIEKRNIALEKVDQIIDKVENEIRKGDSVEVDSKKIGKMVMKHLRKIDNVAYIRFASVYREFADLESFEEELQKIIKRKVI